MFTGLKELLLSDNGLRHIPTEITLLIELEVCPPKTWGPLKPVSALHVTLKDWPEANWQSFVFGNLEKCFHTSQTAKTFPWSTRARGLSRSARVSKKF